MPAPTPGTKLHKLHGYILAGDNRAALQLASKFQELGTHKADITRGWAALTRPDFYCEIGKDPEALVAAGVAAIKARYGWD